MMKDLQMKYSSNYLYVLNHACAGNPGLRAVVEELLAGQGGAEHFFSRAVLRTMSRLTA